MTLIDIGYIKKKKKEYRDKHEEISGKNVNKKKNIPSKKLMK